VLPRQLRVTRETFIFPGTLLSLGDLLAQFVVEKRSLETYDKKRTLRFAIFGTFFGVSCIQFVPPNVQLSIYCYVYFM